MSFQDLEAGRPLASRRELINGKQDSTQAVASGIFQINTAVSTFRRLVNTLGTPKDTPELREKLHKTRLHIGQLVKDTSAKLKQASETDHRADVGASKKITDAKLAKDFEAVLKEFQKAQRLAAERETAYTPFVPQAVLPSNYTASEINVGPEKTQEQRALLVESRSGGGDRCKSHEPLEGSFFCVLGEAQYLNRTLVMDMMVEEDKLSLHPVQDFEVTPMKLTDVKVTPMRGGLERLNPTITGIGCVKERQKLFRKTMASYVEIETVDGRV
ncbi:Syntaxin-22 [Dionaea muscipula]